MDLGFTGYAGGVGVSEVDKMLIEVNKQLNVYDKAASKLREQFNEGNKYEENYKKYEAAQQAIENLPLSQEDRGNLSLKLKTKFMIENEEVLYALAEARYKGDGQKFRDMIAPSKKHPVSEFRANEIKIREIDAEIKKIKQLERRY